MHRLPIIKPTLDTYGDKPFSVLDVGGGIQPTLAIAIANAYPNATVFLIEKDEVKLELPDNVVWLKHEMSVEDMVRLQECEAFNVVIAFNVIHWFEYPKVHRVLTALQRLGDVLYLQLPDAVEEELSKVPNPATVVWAVEKLNQIGAELLAETVQFPGHRARPLYNVPCGRRVLTRTHWDAHDYSSQMVVFKDYKALKKDGSVVEWTPGMNLYNCLKLGITHPSKAKVLEDVETLRTLRVLFKLEGHGDITLHNLILTGMGLVLIDKAVDQGDDERAWEAVRKEIELW